MKIAKFATPTKCLDTFDAKLEKFSKLSRDPIPPSLAIGFFKTAINGNHQLLYTWTPSDTIKDTINAGVAPIYQEYYNFLISTVKKK